PPGPHGIQELVLADDVLAVPHQVEQQVEDLRPDGDRLSAARELPSVRVDHVVLERVPHVALSSPPIAAHRHGRQAIDSTVIIAEARAGCRAGIASGTAGAAARFLGSSCSFVSLFWREPQAKFNRASRPPQGFPAADPASFVASNTRQPDTPCMPLEGKIMKIVVIGGTGLIGSKLVKKLQEKGHDAIAAPPNTRV